MLKKALLPLPVEKQRQVPVNRLRLVRKTSLLVRPMEEEERRPINILPVAHKGSMPPLRTEEQLPLNRTLLVLLL
jgi:hypothetical protein